MTAPEAQINNIIDFTRSSVKSKRFSHILNVVSLSHKLALALNLNPTDAIIAGYLHDCLKEEKSSTLLSLAKQYQLPLDEIELANGHLLHGPVASLLVAEKFNITNAEILNAIAYHTLGHPAMSDLAKVIFLADCLEEDRDLDYTFPIWKTLLEPRILASVKNTKDAKNQVIIISKKKLNKKFIANINFNDFNLNINKAILVACNQNIKYLMLENKIIHPRTIKTRNYYLQNS